MAFFLRIDIHRSVFFGWDRLSKVQHLCVTWLVALGSKYVCLMDFGCKWLDAKPCQLSVFNYETMRMELVVLVLIFNPVAQVKFVHTHVYTGYVTGTTASWLFQATTY